MFITTVITTVACASAVLAVPAPASTGNSSSSGTPFDSSVALTSVTPEQVLAAAPKANCVGNETYPLECTSYYHAQPMLNEAFAQYGLTTLGQLAGVTALMAFESGDFIYNNNHYPGRPGQGTKAMLNFWYIVPFANSFPELAPGVINLNGGKDLVVSASNYTSVANETQSAIVSLVTPIQYTFKAAPWYLTTAADCPADTVDQLSNNGYAGYQYYIEMCVQAGSISEAVERIDSWCTAVEAFSPEGMAMPSECANTTETALISATTSQIKPAAKKFKLKY